MDACRKPPNPSANSTGYEIRNTPRHLIQLTLIKIARPVMRCGKRGGGAKRN
jgi:hypothetical protein